MGVELKDGSAEYWEYKEMAEDIYRDFCAADILSIHIWICEYNSVEK